MPHIDATNFVGQCISVNLPFVLCLICGEYEGQDHAVASGAAREETWQLILTSFDTT